MPNIQAGDDPFLAAQLAEILRRQGMIQGAHGAQYDPGVDPRAQAAPQGVMGMTAPTTPAARPPGIGDRILSGVLGQPNNYGGMLSESDTSAARQRALMAMGASLLSGSGPSPVRRGTGELIGNALMTGAQAQDQSLQNALQAMLLKSKMQPKRSKLQEEYEYARAQGYKGSIDDWKRVSSIEAKDPASIQEYDLARSQGYTGTFRQWVEERAKATVGTPFTPMIVGGVPGFGNRQDATFTPSGTLPGETNAAAQIKEAEARAAELAKAQAGRDATFQDDINVIDDEILRTQRLLTEFKAGKYQTGPLAGRLPNWRTASQDLQREQGKDVIKAISSATFGALSEGERQFLRELGISENASEESNVNMLTERLEKLQRTKDRLQTRSRLGVGPNAAPSATGNAPSIGVGQSTTINGAKVTRKR